MADLKSYTRTVEAYGLSVEPERIGEMLSIFKDCILSVPRIPPVIDARKAYAGFSVLCTSSFLADKKIILINDSKSGSVPGAEPIKLVLKYEYFTYKEILAEALPEGAKTPASFHIVGKILHLNLKDEQLVFRETIGAVLLDKIKGIETVIRKVGEISTEFRYFDIEVLAGTGQLKTVHIENNLKFFIDYGRVYWNSRLQNERRRVLEQLKRGDVVIDPFCGVGPLVVPALKKGCRVYCNDLNPAAVECLKKNLLINHVNCASLTVKCGDAGVFLEAFWGRRIDHVVLNLPSRSLEFIKHLRGYDKNAVLHCYFFCKDGHDPADLVRQHANFRAGRYNISCLRNVSPTKRMYKVEAKLLDVF